MIKAMLDMGPVSEFVEITREALEEMDREEFQASVVDAATRFGMADFAFIADQVAQSAPNEYHHVYEWGEIGNSRGRLFEFFWSTGRRTNYATFDFIPSKKNVPPAKGSGGRGDAVFYYKAAVLEDGGPRVIRVGEKGFLAWYDTDEQEWVYSKKDTVVDNSRDTAGKFTTLWNTYWMSKAPEDTLEKDLIRPYQMKFKATMERLLNAISEGHAVPSVGMRVSIRPRKRHGARVRAEMLQDVNALEQISLVRGRAAGIGRLGDL